MLYSSAECEVLPAEYHGKAVRLTVACCRVIAAFWAILALFMTTGAVVAPPALFVLLVIRGKNPFHATMIGPLSATILGGVALYFGIPAVRAYGLLVQPTRMVSLRFLAIRDLMFGFVFSTVGALAVFLMWRKPEEKLFYSAYVLFGLIVFSLHHAFRRKG